jgi:hypothetical protein
MLPGEILGHHQEPGLDLSGAKVAGTEIVDGPPTGSLSPVSVANEEILQQEPQNLGLLAGVLPIHLSTFGRAVDEFFAQLAGLADEIAMPPLEARLTTWLVAAAAVTGTLGFVRWQFRGARPDCMDERNPFVHDRDWQRRWAPWLLLDLLPPEDDS